MLKELPEGYKISNKSISEDFYLAIPLHKGQMSCRENVENLVIKKRLLPDDQVTLNHIEVDNQLREIIEDRALLLESNYCLLRS